MDADAGAAVPHPRMAPERFAPEPEPTVLLDARSDEQPFVRCLRCGVDSDRYATRCRHCDAHLDTEEVRVYNTRVWEAALATRAGDEEAASRQRRVARASAVPTAEQRALGEGLAAGVAFRERARLLSWFRAGSGWQRATPGLRIKAVAIVLVVSLSALLLVSSPRGSVGLWLGGVGALGALLFLAWRRLR
jgi:hypothetical protein